jgi:transcriptional regulator of acetoin/glycerol metabolism
MPAPPSPSPQERLQQIERARNLVLREGASAVGRLAPAWIGESWRRCLARGQQPEQHVGFDMLPRQALRRVREANQRLVEAARPILDRLGRAIANTHYFAILTNGDGVVVDVNGPIDRSDRRVDVIARVGVDLSEQSVGTTAIGAALTELQPVWLHRGEHFFQDTSVYSCAGAPLFGPDGNCIGMLDLTGVDAVERPELKHLVAQTARSIENALLLGQPHALMLRLNWPGRSPDSESDGLLALDEDGGIVAANQAAREMVPQLAIQGHPPLHSRDLFAMPFETLFDQARRRSDALEAPLWSGLRLQVAARLARRARASLPAAPALAPVRPTGGAGKGETLRDVEDALIRKAVDLNRGNVAAAARSLGISRATVYRKLARKRPAPARAK